MCCLFIILPSLIKVAGVEARELKGCIWNLVLGKPGREMKEYYKRL